MRLIGEVKTPQQGILFSSYLLVEGVACHVDDDNQCEIWVKDEDQFKSALAELQTFLENPDDPKYLKSVQKAKLLARAEEKRRQRAQKKVVRTSNGQLPRNRRVTVGLIVASAIVGLLTGFGERIGFEEGEVRPDAPIYRMLQFNCIGPPNGLKVAIEQTKEGGVNDLGIRLASIKRGQIWRLVTTIFIHYGVFHLVFNMIWLFQLGTLLEHRYGTPFFVFLVIATAAISNLFQCCMPDYLQGSVPGFVRDSGYFMSGGGGMSGVVYGLFGFAWMKSIYDRRCGFRIPQSMIVILIGWLFFCMLPVSMRAEIGFGVNVGNWAHGIGLLVGMGLGYYWKTK